MKSEDVADVPENLAKLLEASREGYQLQRCYFLELEHGLIGFFPAIHRGEYREIVLTIDRWLLGETWKVLSPRKSKISSGLFCVNEALGVGYPIRGSNDGDLESSKPQKLLTRERFTKLTANGKMPFEWVPGLIGDDMTTEEFAQMIRLAQEQGAP